MTNFYEEVYRLVRQVPPGRVTTYGAIAALAGSPLARRAVGYALRNLPPDSDVPWQRVINAQGKVSPRSLEGPEPLRQRHLLEREGIDFDAQDRVDLRRFGWP
ncbi:MAG TPA: MGMT family protein [Oscillatoriaceae cyanobacterium]